jgi:hypothetical protein
MILNDRPAYQGKKQQLALYHCAPERRRTMIDCGAHIGLWSYNFAHWFKKIEAFEPRRAAMVEPNVLQRAMNLARACPDSMLPELQQLEEDLAAGSFIAIETGKLLFEFTSQQDWMNKGPRIWKENRVNNCIVIAVDKCGRLCSWGFHYSIAQKDDAYPVRVYMLRPDLGQPGKDTGEDGSESR